MVKAQIKAESKLNENYKTGIPAKDSRTGMPAVLRILLSVIFLIVFAGIFTWYILLQDYGGDTDRALQFIHNQTTIVAYGYTIILLTMCTIAALLWRPFLTIGISFSLCAIVMYINTQKVLYRDSPFLPEDLLLADQAGTIMKFVDIASVSRLASGVILIVIGAAILERGAQKIFGQHTKDQPWWERHNLVPRMAWTTLALAGLMMFARPVLHYEDEPEQSAWITGLSFSRWNQKSDYNLNGFIISFLYGLGGIHEQEPDGYNRDKIAQIRESNSNTTAKYDQLSEVVDNVIVVLDESFMDPEILGEIYEHTGGDVVPNLHRIFENYPSGYMFSPGYGGGTANIEFEVLTSLSNYWAQTTPYVTSISKLAKVPGLAAEAIKEDFIGTAVHAYDGTMYKRNTVYNRMGFSTFRDSDIMKYTERENNGGYISDRSTFNEVLDVLADGEDKHVVMTVTMQNHVVYNAAGYTEFHFIPLHDVAISDYVAYLETVHHADEYLGEFVDALDKLEQRTVMIWFGDHTPSVLKEYIESGDPKLVDLAHLTPYFIYANFDINEIFTEKEVATLNKASGFEFETNGVSLPVVSANCLASMMYQILDVKMPPLVALSHKVCEENPILAAGYSKISDIQETDTLKDYRLVNYDILSGKHYWLELAN